MRPSPRGRRVPPAISLPLLFVALLAPVGAAPPVEDPTLGQVQALLEQAQAAGRRRDTRGARHRLEEGMKVLEEELARLEPELGPRFDALLAAYSNLSRTLVELHRRTVNEGAQRAVIERSVATIEGLLVRAHGADTGAFEPLAETYVHLMDGMLREQHKRGQRVRFDQLVDRMMATFEALMKAPGPGSRRSLRPLVRAYVEVNRRVGELLRRHGQSLERARLLARVEEHLGGLLGSGHPAVQKIAGMRTRAETKPSTYGAPPGTRAGELGR